MPVTSKKRAPEDRGKFVTCLRHLGNVTRAAEEIGVSRMTVYRWRESDPEFAAEWDSALEEAADRLELEARRRAHDGYEKPVYQQGQLVGMVREYSDTLLIFLLKGLRPDKFRENRTNSVVNVTGPMKLTWGGEDGNG